MSWLLKLDDLRDHVTEVVFKDETDALLNLAGYGATFRITHAGGEIVWNVASGHVAIANPTTLGKIVLTVPRTQIVPLVFSNAKFDFYLDLPGNVGSEKIYSGQVSHVEE